MTTMSASAPNAGREDPLLGTDRADVFFKLSALLTGVDDLDPVLSEDYRQKLETKYGPELQQLCTLYYDAVREQDAIGALKRHIGSDAALLRAARQVVNIWYLSQFADPDPNIKVPIFAGHYERGLLWRVIDAHPPAISARRHGYWAGDCHTNCSMPHFRGEWIAF